jgi:hypothetical protein
MQTHSKSNAIKERKVNKSKVKETKENEIKDIDIDKSIPITFKKWTLLDFENDIKLHRAAVNLETSELMNFYNHWRELTPTGKMRFQLETTWQTDLRLKKWESNLNKWSKNTPQTKQDDQKAKMNNAFNELANKYLNEL